MRFGRYDLIERIGKGGMAEVWKAKLLGPEGYARTLAVKRILPNASDPASNALFLREARVLAQLRHRAVVQVFELDEVDGQPYLAMEYIDGLSLFQLIRQLPDDQNLDAGLCALIVQEVCYALGYLHTLSDENHRPLGLIHRDVSPHNVMLSVDGAVKVLDFGVAKPTSVGGDKLTGTGVTRGKIGYMSWEHIEGVDVDQRVDTFSAGVVLWELLCAQRLFKDRSDFAGLRAQRTDKVTPPSQIRPGVPPELDAICLRAMAFDRNERYRDANEMADALAAVAKQLGARTDKLAELVRERQPAARLALPVDSVPIETARRPARWPWVLGVCIVALGGGVAVGLRMRQRRPPSAQTTAQSRVDLAANPLDLALPDLAVPQPAPPQKPKPKPKHMQTNTKRHTPLRNLGKGQIVDPFSRPR